jgi:hypothetical protein
MVRFLGFRQEKLRQTVSAFAVAFKKGKVSNIEYGNIEKWEHRKMLSSKTVTSNLTSKTVTSTVKRGQTGGQTGSPVGGPPADDDRGCYDPV